jgi:protein involved in polysaccharide export with SLBB domain
MKKAFYVGVIFLVTLCSARPALGQDDPTQQVATPQASAPKPSKESGKDKGIKEQDKVIKVQVPLAAAKTVADDLPAPEKSSTSPAVSDKARKYYESGTALYSSGKVDQAVDAFKQAIQVAPEDSLSYFGLGMAYFKAKNYKEATESFKRAARFKPDWPEAHFRLGWMYYVLGRNAQATDEYDKLVKLNSPLAQTLRRIIGKAAKDSASTGSLPGVANGQLPASKNDGIIAASRQHGDKRPTSKSRSAERKPTNAPAPISIQSSSKNDGTVEAEALPSSSASTASAEVSETSALSVDESTLTGTYRVGIADVLDIKLLNSDTTRSTLYTVLDGGLIDFPLVGGPVAVAGLTANEIQNRLVSELKRRAVQDGAQVVVGIRQYASHAVIITGLTANPGTRFLRREAVPLYVVLAEAQPRLDAARATIMRANTPSMTIDLNDPTALSLVVRPGDLINLTARPQEYYYIAGRVNSPGQKVFQPGITLLQAILAAGGLARQSDNTVELSREAAAGRLSTTTFNLKDIKAGNVPDQRLQPGDRIQVLH